MIRRTLILTEKGQSVSAFAPVIVSASRSTDIPAFFPGWFMNRLDKGYAVWYNPFNRQPLYVSFQDTKVIVFWTKNPAPMIPYLPELDRRGIHYYFQVTLNNYEKEKFEPNVPPLAERIAAFRQLSGLIGKERVIWRFDPVIFTQALSPRELLSRIEYIGNELKGYTDKLVFSFLDVLAYRKVQRNLIRETRCFSRENIQHAEPSPAQIHEFVRGLAGLRECWKKENRELSLATCAEQMDLSAYRIEHNRCIDGELMERLFQADKELLYYLRTGRLPEPDLFGELPVHPVTPKDSGQRKSCGCMISKDIGMYNTCRHLCVYCYANSGKKAVLTNLTRHSGKGESIIR